MDNTLRQVVEFVNQDGNSSGGAALPKVNANGTEDYRAGAEMIPYHYDQPKEVVKFYDKEDVKKACQAWANPYSGLMVPSPNNYLVMQAGPNGWNQYNIGAPLMPLPWADMGFYPVGKKYHCNGEGFFIMLDKRGPVQFSDFLMYVSSINMHYMFDDEELSKSFEVTVLDSLDYTFKLDVPASKWKNLLAMIVAEDPVCTIFMDEVPRAGYYFQQVAALLLRRRNIPCKTIVDRWGWGPVKPNGGREFYHGGRDGCTSSKKLMIDPTISMAKGWSIADVGEHQVTIPLLVYGAACYMDAIFTDAGYPLDFCLMLVGDSGYKKTALSKAMFNVFIEEPNKRIHSVRGTEAVMHALTEELFDDQCVIDDLNLEGSIADVRQKVKNVQTLLRTYGAQAPSQKMVQKHSFGYRVRGGCIFTAEHQVQGQIKSSTLRYLTVELHSPIDGGRLSEFQQNQAIMQCFWSRWIKYLEGNYGRIGLQIQEAFPRYRAIAPGREPRLKDDFAHMMIVLDELDKFLQVNCGCRVDRHEASEIIIGLVNRQEEEANVVEPYIRVLAEIFKLLGSGQLKLAPNAEEYAATLLPLVGYEEVGGLYMMQPDLVYTAAVESARKRGDDIPITLAEVKKKFKEKSLSLCDKDSLLKRATDKIKPRPRMLCLRVPACLKMLEEVKG